MIALGIVKPTERMMPRLKNFGGNEYDRQKVKITPIKKFQKKKKEYKRISSNKKTKNKGKGTK